MAMLEGTVVIDPTTGNVTSKSGAAGEVFDAMEVGQDYGDLAATNPIAYAAAREQIAVLAKAVAKIIPHITTNAQVSVTTTVGFPIPVQVVPATGTGGTTGPGTGSGSGTIT